MKKIFLPVLALCGMITGLTLTSCGGGGGGSGNEVSAAARKFAGRTYTLGAQSAGALVISFGDVMPNSGMLTADFEWIVSENGTDNVESPGYVEVSNPVYAGDSLDSCELLIYGWNMEVSASSAANAFFGVPISGEGIDGQPSQTIGSYSVLRVAIKFTGMATSPTAFDGESIASYYAKTSILNEETGEPEEVMGEFPVDNKFKVIRDDYSN